MKSALPTIKLTEEGLREGVQIEDVNISIEDKLRLLDALSDSGLQRIVVGAFVSPKWTPQMAQVDELIERMNPRPGISYLALVLNDRGRERMAAHVPPLTMEDRPPALHTHMCPVFIKRNTNRTVEQERAGWDAIVERAVTAGKKEVMIGLSSAWGSNWCGAFSLEQRMDRLQEQYDAWEGAGLTVTDVLLADPMGWCMPHWVAEDLLAIKQRWPAIRRFRPHVHNQRGMAVASTYAAIAALGSEDTLYIDTTIGGIGGCPYCGNGRAAGMAPTEDIVQMLEAMGVDTGVDLYKLVDAAVLASEILGRPLEGHVSKAGPLPSKDRLYSQELPLIETHEQAQHFRLGPAVTAGLPRPWKNE